MVRCRKNGTTIEVKQKDISLTMKKILVFLVLAGALTTAQAQSMLKVRLADNAQFKVAVDGRYFNKLGTSITVGDLPYGRHTVKIYTYTQSRRGRTFEELIYTGSIKTYEGMISLFVLDPYTKETRVSEEEIDAYGINQPAPNSPGRNDRYIGTTGKFDTEPANKPNTNTATNNDDNYVPPASPVASPVSADMLGTLTDAEQQKLKTKVEGKPTDTDRLLLIKSSLKNEKVTTMQVSDMMDWFTFESSKVDFVKWAYTITVDKEFYGDLAGKFAFKNSQDELNQFIRK